MKPQVERALGKFLAVRERSRAEIARYLKHKNVEDQEISVRLDRWEEVGLIDDSGFIASLIKSYLHKGKGQLFMRHKLSQAGIEPKRAEEALIRVSAEEIREAMERKLEKNSRRLAALPEPLKRQQAYSSLRASGFLSQEALRFIDDWAKKG